MFASRLYKLLNGYDRLYNITPFNNIQSILQNGILSNKRASKLPHNSVANPSVQAIRANKKIGKERRSLHSYANLYFNPRNKMMFVLHCNNASVCVLHVQSTILDLPDVLVSDANMGSAFAKVGTPKEMLRLIPYEDVFVNSWNVDDPVKRTRLGYRTCAEVLVPDIVLPEYFIGISVKNKQDEQALISMGVSLPIYVRPNTFFE